MTNRRSQLLSTLETQQREAWLRGQKLFVEAFFERHPELSEDLDSAVELIEREFILRQQAGEEPQLDEYCQRFPHLAEKLRNAIGLPSEGQREVATRTLASSGQKTKLIVCPFCSTNITTDSTVARVQCENCGNQVHVLDETKSLKVGPGGRLGSFELLVRIGWGQYGEVWRARDVSLRRDVALKIPRTRDADAENVDLFQREARAIARIDHPNIISVYEVGNDDGLVYIVTEFVNGTNLKALLKEKRFTPEEAARLCSTLAGALHHAHLAGVVHRDIKPSNVLIDERGTPHIADFGLAKHFSIDEVTITSTGDVVGTPAYMSPEQARGRSHEATPASDIYSLGAMLYELLTRERPFEGNFETLYYRIMNEPPRPPRSIDPQVPLDLETICLKAIAKLPADRYSDAQAMADDLDRYLRGDLIHARRATLIEKSARWTRRNWLKAGSVALLAGGTGVAAAAFSNWRNRSNIPPHLRPRPVRITTEPLGAHVAFIPLDQRTGRPLPEMIEHADTKPNAKWATAELAPGDYLIVAEVPGFGFHEVWRHVPGAEEVIHIGFSHWNSHFNEGYVELPKITVRAVAAGAALAQYPGDASFQMGFAKVPDLPPHTRSIQPFLLDATEVSIAEYCLHKGRLATPLRDKSSISHEPVTYVSWDEAMRHAERVGKRLPDEAEFEFAASQGGGAIQPSIPVEGLTSGVAEWTLSRFTLYPPLEEAGVRLPVQSFDARIARGGTIAVIEGRAKAEDLGEQVPFLRTGLIRSRFEPGLGFRCARSTKPRFLAKDFGR